MAAERSFLNAVKWAYTANWGEKAFSSLFTFILAALLGPRDFGIVAVAMIYIGFVQMFMNQGLVAALIQKKDLRSEHLSSVFWMNLILGLGLAGLSVLSGRWWAGLNHIPELSRIICVLSLCIPIEALALVQMALLQRELDFRSLSLRANASVLIGGVVGIGLAYKGCGVWALVGQQLVRDVAALWLLWKQSEWRPSFLFSWKYLSELFRFSVSNFAAQLGIFADGQSGAILLSLLFGPVAVGLFRLAERLVSAVLAVATSSIQAVTLPEFSRLQDKPDELRKSILTAVRLCATVTLPAMAGLVAVSDSLMSVLGSKWTPASDVLKILSLLGMVSMFSIFTGPLLQALSRPHYLAAMEWARTLTGGVVLCIAALFVRNLDIHWQVAGIALARFSVGALLVLPIFMWLLLHLSKLRFTEVLISVIPSGVAAATAFGSVILLNWAGPLANSKAFTSLIAKVTLGGATGLIMLFALDSQLRCAVFGMVRRMLSDEMSINQPA